MEAAVIRNESIAAIPVSTGRRSTVAIVPNTDFEARCAAWQTREVAPERAVQRRLTLVASPAGSLATAAAIASMLLHP